MSEQIRFCERCGCLNHTYYFICEKCQKELERDKVRMEGEKE